MDSDFEKVAVGWNPYQKVHMKPRPNVHCNYIDCKLTCYFHTLGELVLNSLRFEISKLEVMDSDLEKVAVGWNPYQKVHIKLSPNVHCNYIDCTRTCYFHILGVVVPNSLKFEISKLEVMDSDLEKVAVGWNP